MYILYCLFSFLFLYDSWSSEEGQYAFVCAEIYTYYPTFRPHCLWQSIPFSRTPSTFVFFFPSLVSVLLLLAVSLVHVVPWPTSCQPSQLVSAPGNFSFRIKLYGISLLGFSPFPCFLALSSSWLVFKIMIVREIWEEYPIENSWYLY